MRRNRPQREQMPDSSVQCMWSSNSQITNEPFVSRTQVQQLQRNARTEGPQPKRLPSNGNPDLRRVRRNRPQREQMPHSSMQCMRPSKSQITNQPFVSQHTCCNGEEEPKDTTTREREGEWSWNIRTGPACKAGDHTRVDPKTA